MSEKRKRVAHNQWAKFLNRCTATYIDKPKTTIMPSNIRNAMRRELKAMVEARGRKQVYLMGQVFGAYVFDDKWPRLVGYEVNYSIHSDSTTVVLQFAKLGQLRLVEEFAKNMILYSGMAISHTDTEIHINMKLPDRYIPMWPKPAKPQAPVKAEPDRRVLQIDVGNMTTEELRLHVQSIQSEINRRNTETAEAMVRAYIADRARLLEQRNVLRTAIEQFGMSEKYAGQFNVHAV
ncbi:hypothetical protein [Aeromonas phage phiWae14]|nr:hypothetical protein [Aeromonas phage phiWae14]